MLNLPFPKTRTAWAIGFLSLAVLLVVAALLLLPRPTFDNPPDVSWLPTLNAGLNGMVALLLPLGVALIRRRRVQAHRVVMVTAFALSALFLVSYVILHTVAGSTHFTATGWIRPVYFTILISHILLSVVVLPMAMTTLHRGWVGRRRSHRQVARWAFPIWLYTAVSGVLVYLLLYHWPG